MFEKYRNAVKKINPWIRALLIALVIALIAYVSYQIAGWHLKPLTVQSGITADGVSVSSCSSKISAMKADIALQNEVAAIMDVKGTEEVFSYAMGVYAALGTDAKNIMGTGESYVTMTPSTVLTDVEKKLSGLISARNKGEIDVPDTEVAALKELQNELTATIEMMELISDISVVDDGPDILGIRVTWHDVEKAKLIAQKAAENLSASIGAGAAVTEAVQVHGHGTHVIAVTVIVTVVLGLIAYIFLSGLELFDAINYLIFALITLACVFPFYYLFINTISSNELVRLGEIQLYPREIHFENYVQVFKISGIMDAAFVSVARTVLGTLWTVAGCAFLGYLVTKQEMWLRKVWYRLIIITMYFSAGLIPWYMNLRNLGFLDNFWVYVIPGLVSPYNVILVKTFIEGLPPSLEESATLDGAGYCRVFVSVIMPLITPILATLAIFSAVGQWNSFTDTMMLMPSGKNYTLQFLLYKYQREAQSLAALVRSTQDVNALASLATKQTSLSVQMTVAMVVTFPILLVYPFFQRFFVKGIMIGAVKG